MLASCKLECKSERLSAKDLNGDTFHRRVGAPRAVFRARTFRERPVSVRVGNRALVLSCDVKRVDAVGNHGVSARASIGIDFACSIVFKPELGTVGLSFFFQVVPPPCRAVTSRCDANVPHVLRERSAGELTHRNAELNCQQLRLLDKIVRNLKRHYSYTHDNILAFKAASAPLSADHKRSTAPPQSHAR